MCVLRQKVRCVNVFYYAFRFAVQLYNMAQLVDWKIYISIKYATDIKRAMCGNVNYQ